jgi:hypothetical protein
MILAKQMHMSAAKIKEIEGIHVKNHQFHSQISTLSSPTPRIFHIFAPNKVHEPATVSIHEEMSKKK